jgi:hypothetical protein
VTYSFHATIVSQWDIDTAMNTDATVSETKGTKKNKDRTPTREYTHKGGKVIKKLGKTKNKI